MPLLFFDVPILWSPSTPPLRFKVDGFFVVCYFITLKSTSYSTPISTMVIPWILSKLFGHAPCKDSEFVLPTDYRIAMANTVEECSVRSDGKLIVLHRYHWIQATSERTGVADRQPEEARWSVKLRESYSTHLLQGAE